MNKHWECKYCDGVNPTYWHGEKEEPMICGNCGAEWEDAKILVEDDEDYDDEDYSDYEGE